MNTDHERKIAGNNPGKPIEDIKRLKIIWRNSMPKQDQDYWRSRFKSAVSQKVLRAEILDKLHINLTKDKKLTLFRQWVQDRDKELAREQKLDECREKLISEHPDWTTDQVRDELHRRDMEACWVQRDYKEGRKAIRSELESRKFQLHKEMFLQSPKSDQARDIERCMQEGGALPEVLDMFQATFAALKQSRKAGEMSEKAVLGK
jgi:hypothetical protein